MIGYQSDCLHIADIHAFEPHGRADAKATGVIEIRNQMNLLGKNAASTTHEKDQNGKSDAREQDGESYA